MTRPWLTNVDFGPAQLAATGVPSRDNWLQSVNYVTSTHLPKTGTRTLIVAELQYTVQGVGGATRTRRCFVGHPYVDNALPHQKPILLVALPSTSVIAGAGGGAKALWNFGSSASVNIEFDWPLEVMRDTGCYSVMIDGPRYGANPYTPTNAYDSIIDMVAGIDAARWFIGSIPLMWYGTLVGKPFDPNVRPVFELSKKLVIGGLSYGAIMGSFLAGVLPDAEAAYLTGAYVVKATQAFQPTPNPPDMYPADWVASGFDYTDMLLASNIKKCMISYGWDNGLSGVPPSDYARVSTAWPTALIDAASAKLIADPRFQSNICGAPAIQGHEWNMPHAKPWLKAAIDGITL